MENVEVKNEMVEATTNNKAKGFIVGGIAVAAVAVVATLFKKFKKNKVEAVAEPVSDEAIFDIDEEVIR